MELEDYQRPLKVDVDDTSIATTLIVDAEDMSLASTFEWTLMVLHKKKNETRRLIVFTKSGC